MGDSEAGQPTTESPKNARESSIWEVQASVKQLTALTKGGLLGVRDLVQWTRRHGLYFAAGETIDELPIGCYKFEPTDAGIAFLPLELQCDELIEFPNGPSARVLRGIENFWGRKSEFIRRGHLFKRGVLLCGPAGSGKSSIVMLLAGQIMNLGGIVTVTTSSSTARDGLAILRKVEPARPIVNVIEDIEELLESEGDRAMLSLLDGQDQVQNIVHVATTNFPERLGARIIKRPSRFDEVVEVSLPDADSRRIYLERLLRRGLKRGDLGSVDLEKWVDATEGMSFAFLRELHVAVFCLGCLFEETIERLKVMLEKPEPIEEYPRRKIGLVPTPTQVQTLRKVHAGEIR